MASGKQLSFGYGEVSQALRFRADAQFYSQALRTAINGFIRKTGGISNRAGFKYIFKDNDNSVERMPIVGGTIAQRIFPFTGSDGIRLIIFFDNILKANIGFTPSLSVTTIRELDEGVGVLQATQVGIVWPVDLLVDELLTLGEACITTLGDSAIITVPGSSGKVWTFIYRYTPPLYPSTAWLFELVSLKLDVPAKIGTPAAGAINQLNYGLEPFDVPVCYMITQEQDDGSEVKWLSFCFAQGHPHSQLSGKLSGPGFECPSISGVKQYNVYRSAGTGANSIGAEASHYALVGRIKPVIAGDTSLFIDYLTVADLTTQPPTDSYLYAPDGYIRKVAYYKERAIYAYANYTPPGAAIAKYIEGQMGASKLGTPRMLGRPLTPNLIDAFSFTIPSDKLQKITHLLPLNRLIVFTRKHTFMVRGGDNGVLTSKDVNPETIYFEGAPEDVAPVASGSNGFYVSSDKSKLLMINYSPEQSGAKVFDVSTFSNHLFSKRDIRNMVVCTGSETIIWILKMDGTLISFTMAEDSSIQGFARHKTDGYIEDICVQEIKENVYEGDTSTNWVPTLYISVIRGGFRRYERMAVRNDLDPKRFMYADYAVTFGRVKSNGLRPFNITTLDVYSGGGTLRLEDKAANGTLDITWVGKRIDFFFNVNANDPQDVNKTIEAKVRIIVSGLIDGNVLEGYCEENIPEEIQDVQSQVLTAAEKLVLQNKWLEAINKIEGVTRLANQEISVYAEGVLIASPKNENFEKIVVANDGTINLPDYYCWGYYGLPYEYEIETLDLEASDARTFTDVGKLINRVGVGMENTQGGLVGQTGKGPFSSFEALTDREEDSILETTKPITGYRTVNYPSTWDMTGRVTIKQIDPLPISVLSIYPKGVAGEP